MHFEVVLLFLLSIKLVQGDDFIEGEKRTVVPVEVVNKITNDNDIDNVTMIINNKDSFSDSENNTIAEEWKLWTYLVTDPFDLTNENAKEISAGEYFHVYFIYFMFLRKICNSF